MSVPDGGPVLLLGAAGQLGAALVPRLARLGRLAACTRADVDLERPAAIRTLVREVKPRLVVNAAAYTAVDAAEEDVARCTRLNADAPTILAEESARRGVPILDFSTNYVFDGLSDVPYDESAATAPLSVYGRTKESGERGIVAANSRHLILRTAALYSVGGSKNFVRRILELAREREELRVVADQFVSPTPVSVLADATIVAITKLLEGDGAVYGTFHLTTTSSASWHEFAQHIVQHDADHRTLRVRSIVPITTNEYPVPARRPANGVLNTTRFERTFGVSLPRWDDALRHALDAQSVALSG
jgi:dTDP-4-dehydrorhamnose reductase